MTPHDRVPVEPGRQFGSYIVESLIGAGGMGEVYRARDTRLGRDVALKVLSTPFAENPDRLGRFEREALLLASLNHPNIGIIYGLEEVGGVRALVLELIEGQTLAERITLGPIPLPDALALAHQIADALQSAHDNGVIHRDLKPANIKVRRDGTLKVLDFGLAKLTGELPGTGAGPRVSNTPTMIASMPGLLLGTAAYMSPEQAKGHEADRRSDVWAFGCVLFEMLSGRAAFAGDSSTEVLASVLKTEPDWTRLPADTPEGIRRLLRRCLEKDDRRRVWDIADARLELDAARVDALAPRLLAVPRRRAERLAWGSALAVLALLTVAIGLWRGRPAPAAPEIQFDINTPTVSDPEDLSSLAVSPDGQRVVFVAKSEGQPSLWVRPLDAVVARPLPGTADSSMPFWSPDSRSVAFFADGQLKRLDLDGGLLRTLAQATRGVGGAWNRDGVILFGPNPASPIFRISANSGTPVRVTRLDASHSGHGMPSFLPDGRHFLYIASGTPDSRGVYLGQLDESTPRKLIDADTAAVYAAGHLLFLRQGKLFAQSFDADRLEVRGSPFLVMDGVSGGDSWGLLAAAGGTIAVRVGRARMEQRLAWFERSGMELQTLGDLNSAIRSGLSPSPDGEHLVYFRRGETNSDIWVLETRRNLRSRLTSDPGEDIFPIWSRDGDWIVFSSNRSQNGGFALYQKRAAGNDDEKLVLAATPEETFASDTSPDGQVLLYQRRSTKTGWDVWALPLRGGGQPTPVVQTEFDERDGQLSPDGKWLAYIANNSGHFDVYVQPFPGPGPRQQVSTSGGVQLRWRPDGQEIFYIALDSTLMAATMKVAADGRSLTVGIPVPLFATRVGHLMTPGPNASYVASADGKRFLMNTLVADSDASPIRVIANWKGRP